MCEKKKKRENYEKSSVADSLFSFKFLKSKTTVKVEKNGAKRFYLTLLNINFISQLLDIVYFRIEVSFPQFSLQVEIDRCNNCGNNNFV